MWTRCHPSTQLTIKYMVLNLFTGSFVAVYALPQRARARSAARPVLNMIRAVVAARSGAVRVEHVYSHQTDSSFPTSSYEQPR